MKSFSHCAGIPILVSLLLTHCSPTGLEVPTGENFAQSTTNSDGLAIVRLAEPDKEILVEVTNENGTSLEGIKVFALSGGNFVQVLAIDETGGALPVSKLVALGESNLALSFEPITVSIILVSVSVLATAAHIVELVESPPELEFGLIDDLGYTGTCLTSTGQQIVGILNVFTFFTGSIDTVLKDLFFSGVSELANFTGLFVLERYLGSTRLYEVCFWEHPRIPRFGYISIDEVTPKIAATFAGYDDVGAVLTEMGYDIDFIDESSLSQPGILSQYDLLFINCSSGILAVEESAAIAVRDFVNGGGGLYTSDFAAAVVAQAFPGKVAFGDRKGHAGIVTATVVDAGLLHFLINPVVSINYDLNEWVTISAISEEVQVFLRGSPTTSSNMAASLTRALPTRDVQHQTTLEDERASLATATVDVPLAVGFASGEGYVVHATFHNHSQISNLEEKVLRYLISKL